MSDRRPIVLSIAGSDPCGGAGTQRDQREAEAMECRLLNVVTCIAVQNDHEVTAVYPMERDIVSAQIRLLLDSFTIRAIKIGAIPSASVAELIAGMLPDRNAIPVVLDPVLAPTRGPAFLRPDEIMPYRDALLPRVSVVTPNLGELATLAGGKSDCSSDIITAAKSISARFDTMLFVKGGHGTGAEIVEYLVCGDNVTVCRKPRVDLTDSHGTGCAFSTVLACYLAQGVPVEESVRLATAQVSRDLAQPSGVSGLFGTGL